MPTSSKGHAPRNCSSAFSRTPRRAISRSTTRSADATRRESSGRRELADRGFSTILWPDAHTFFSGVTHPRRLHRRRYERPRARAAESHLAAHRAAHHADPRALLVVRAVESGARALPGSRG